MRLPCHGFQKGTRTREFAPHYYCTTFFIFKVEFDFVSGQARHTFAGPVCLRIKPHTESATIPVFQQHLKMEMLAIIVFAAK